MLDRLQHRIRQTAQRFALGGIGAVLALVGLGFLSASVFMLLLTQTDPITACAIMGGGFFGTGLIITWLAGAPNKPRSSDDSAAKQEAMPPIAAAFMQGMAQGMAVKQTR
ncbi:hypothetical protein ROLI_000380 [Roseobacter fucihabitans]|uniref:Uncharacterized protein n=1 Tax=Roseobacter fucihabitans TaxID=1537242 RepID=A0ABZ2BNC0_9RHOB|nr:phage holin family protein [Roseobacter litoralis]MBC6966503.1 hypothetical protein [Roseobacter litoralis]